MDADLQISQLIERIDSLKEQRDDLERNKRSVETAIANETNALGKALGWDGMRETAVYHVRAAGRVFELVKHGSSTYKVREVET